MFPDPLLIPKLFLNILWHVFICDLLCDLLPFVRLKHLKTPMKEYTFNYSSMNIFCIFKLCK